MKITYLTTQWTTMNMQILFHFSVTQIISQNRLVLYRFHGVYFFPITIFSQIFMASYFPMNKMWNNNHFLETFPFFIRENEHPYSVSFAETSSYARLLKYYQYRSCKLCKGSITKFSRKFHQYILQQNGRVLSH